MDKDEFYISKKQLQVRVWIHPEGSVIGSIFLQTQSDHHQGEETLQEVLGKPDSFLVVGCEGPEPIRFYNKRSIVRLDYDVSETESESGKVVLPCRLSMMDGALLSGTIEEFLATSHARLYDYLNIPDQGFIKLHLGDDRVCLVNKAYIVRANPA